MDLDFSHIEELSARLAGMRPLDAAALARIREELVIEGTYNSNAIEGNTLTLRETALIIQHGVTIAEKPIKDHLEAIGYKDAFYYILTQADRTARLTERVIKLIHSLVLVNDAQNRGVWRSVPVRILGAQTTPPQPYLIQPQMERLLEDYESQRQARHIIEASAEFHLRFENIHPFIDGNGRTGRLILNLELIKAGLLPVNIKFADRRKYYDCFDSYANEGTVEPLAQLIGKYEVEELERHIELLTTIN